MKKKKVWSHEFYLSSIVTKNIGEVVQPKFKDLLGGLGLGTSGVDEGGNGRIASLSVGVWPPEAFGSTGIELRHRSWELESFVTSDSANLEAAAWTPIFARLNTTHWWIKGRTEAACKAKTKRNVEDDSEKLSTLETKKSLIKIKNWKRNETY